MKNEVKIRCEAEDRKDVNLPVILVTGGLIVLIGLLVWFGMKDPEVFFTVRDLVIVLTSFILFLLGTVIAVLCFILASNIDSAKVKIDQALMNADGKIEEIALMISEILKKILDPVVEMKAHNAGILRIFAKK